MSYLNRPLLVCQITNFCSSRCLHCFNNSEKWISEKRKEINPNILQEYIRAFKAVSVNPPHIVLSGGGEPTLHSKFRQILKMLASEKVTFDIVTNCNNWEKWYNFAVSDKKIRPNLNLVVLSVLGPEEIHNKITSTEGFTKSMSFAKACKANSVKCYIMCVLSKLNIAYINNMIELFLNLGIDGKILFYPCLPTPYLVKNKLLLDDKDKDFLKKMQKKVSNHIVIGGLHPFLDYSFRASCEEVDGDKFSVDYNGNLRFCCDLIGLAYENNGMDIIGNIKETALLDLLQRREVIKLNWRRHFLEELFYRTLDTAKMGKCEWCIVRHFRKLQS